ncbi:MAG: hypothetical protein ACKO96_10850, partial [Flammeovirgaceae bacterium]
QQNLLNMHPSAPPLIAISCYDVKLAQRLLYYTKPICIYLKKTRIGIILSWLPYERMSEITREQHQWLGGTDVGQIKRLSSAGQEEANQ